MSAANQDLQQGQAGRARPGVPSFRPSRRVVGSVGLVLLGLYALDQCVIAVPQNAVASITRFGALHEGPLDPGLHFKLPFVDTAYTVETSWQNRSIEAITAKTIDNQTVTLAGVNLTYRIPKESANQALFKVGAMGTRGISENFVPVVMDRALRVLGHFNTLDVNPRKDQIANEIMAIVGPEVRQTFGVEIGSIQIPQIKYDPVFEQSVANAVAAKNQAIQAEAELRRIQIQAQQAEATARGTAAAQIAQADATAHATEVQATAQARAIEVTARANAAATRLAGLATAEATKAKVEAVGGAEPYIRTLAAEALGRWNGSVPSVVLSGDKGGPMVLPLPMPLPAGLRTGASN